MNFSFRITLSPQEYLSAAVEYLQGQGENEVEEMKAIWVASTDPNVIGEVRALAPEYFPNVPDEAIVWVSGGEDGGAIATHSKFEVGHTHVCISRACVTSHFRFAIWFNFLRKSGGITYQVEYS